MGPSQSSNQTDLINYSSLLKRYSWIIQRNQNCILSPDSDGFLCGLLVTNLLNWSVVGYYDGKVMVAKNGISPKSCIFLDAEINRAHIKSVGQHLVIYNNRLQPPNFNFVECIQPNILRKFDGKTCFQRKYPFATIHFLLALYQAAGLLKGLSKESTWPLLFTDGVWNNLFGYTENCLEWINFLRINEKNNILNALLCSSPHSFYEIMIGINDLLQMRDGFNAKGAYFKDTYTEGGRNKRTGDKLRFSDSKRELINLVESDKKFNVHNKEKERMEGFISKISEYMEWKYISEKWTWENFDLLRFKKGDFEERALNNTSYLELMNLNPLSLAMTSGSSIEYTLEESDKL